MICAGTEKVPIRVGLHCVGHGTRLRAYTRSASGHRGRSRRPLRGWQSRDANGRTISTVGAVLIEDVSPLAMASASSEEQVRVAREVNFLRRMKPVYQSEDVDKRCNHPCTGAGFELKHVEMAAIDKTMSITGRAF